MYYPNEYLTKNIRTQQINDYLRQAEQERLLWQAGLKRPNLLLRATRATWHAMRHLHLAIHPRLDQIQPLQNQMQIGRAVTSK